LPAHGVQRGHHLRTIDRAHIDAMAQAHGHQGLPGPHDGEH
jgi:hypothetical protein